MINIFINMEDVFEIHEVIFEIYVGDKLVNKQTSQAPKQMLIATFMQTMQQIAQDQRPMKIRMLKPETIWDKFEWKQKTIENEISFSNNAMISWEEKQEVNNEGNKE